MAALQYLLFALLAVSGPAVVLTRDPAKQAVAVSFYGLVLAMLFFAFEAPDVALSQLTVGAVALPLMILLALARIRGDAQKRAAAKGAAK